MLSVKNFSEKMNKLLQLEKFKSQKHKPYFPNIMYSNNIKSYRIICGFFIRKNGRVNWAILKLA